MLCPAFCVSVFDSEGMNNAAICKVCNSVIYILYFVFCILYFVFCILYFVFSKRSEDLEVWLQIFLGIFL